MKGAPKHPPTVLIVRIADRWCAINGMRTDAPRSAWVPVAEFLMGQDGKTLTRFTHRAGTDLAVSFGVHARQAFLDAAREAGITVRGGPAPSPEKTT